jgi:hypothetical protein
VGKDLPALQYLSRYLYRGVLPDKNIISNVDGQVSFEYQDIKLSLQKYARYLPLNFYG